MKHNEYDGAWKDILDQYLQQCIDYCLPKLSKLIDWSRKWIPLDKELAAITKGAKADKRVADKLYKLYLKDGSEKWLLCLPDKFELEYLQAVYEIEESKNMNYISTAERLGVKKGHKEGLAEGLEKVAKNLLKNKEPLSYVAKNTGLTLARVKALQDELKKSTQH